MPRKRLWTLAEAQAALPALAARLDEARAHVAAMHEARAQLEDLRIIHGDEAVAVGTDAAAEFQEHLAAFQSAGAALEDALRAFRHEGVEVKDVETGLLDFRTRMGDKVVYLCWRDGEDRIAHWHTLEGGFAGRQPLPHIDLGAMD